MDLNIEIVETINSHTLTLTDTQIKLALQNYRKTNTHIRYANKKYRIANAHIHRHTDTYIENKHQSAYTHTLTPIQLY